MDQADVIVRIAAATLALALLLGLLRDARQDKLALYYGLFALGLVGFLAGNTPMSGLKLDGGIGDGLSLLSGFNAIFLWWFVLSVFDDDFRPGALVAGVSASWFVIAAANRGVFGAELQLAPLNPILLVMATGMVAHLLWRLYEDREGDLMPGRRFRRGVLIAAIVGLLAIDVAIDVLAGPDWKPQALTIGYNVAILVVLVFLSRLLTSFRVAPLRLHPRGYVGDAKGVTAALQFRKLSALASRIEALMTEERVYLDPELSFASFVEKTDHPEAEVRQYINRTSGYRHFRAFLNSYRISEAQRLLADPKRAGDKIATIAFDAGFASMASFHRAFNAAVGMAPGAFRAQRMSEKAETNEF